MKDFFHSLLIALFWPALSFAQSIFIDSPSEGETDRWGKRLDVLPETVKFTVKDDND